MWLKSEQQSDIKDRAFFFQAEDGIRDVAVTGVQTCALPISTRCSTERCVRPASSVTITGFAAAARRRASSEIADGSAAGADGMLATAGGFVAIVSSRNSIGTETNTGPWGAAIASWQARWMVDGRSALVFRP